MQVNHPKSIQVFLLLSLLISFLFLSDLPLKANSQENNTLKAFTDVTDYAGVGHKHTVANFHPKFTNVMAWISAGGAAAACGDYNNDGYLDIYVTDNIKFRPNVLYKNNGDLTFTDVAETAGVAFVNDDNGVSTDVAWGDYDNDGDLDLYIARFGPNLLFRNNGDGTFTDVTKEAGVGDEGNGICVVFVDYNNDSHLDIILANYFAVHNLWDPETPNIMHNNFEQSTNAGPNLLYRSNGDGTFTNVAPELGIDDTSWSLDIGCGDYDNDGDQDIYVANDFGKDRLHRNNGDGTFTDVTEQSCYVPESKKGMNVDFGDYDNDGFLDIYISNLTSIFIQEGNMLWHNNGDGTFTDVSRETETFDGGWSWGAKFLDYDNDGDLDIFDVNGFLSAGEEECWEDFVMFAITPDVEVANALNWPAFNGRSFCGYEPCRLFRNEDGGFTFKEVAEECGIADKRDGRGIALGDYDNDGDLDIYIINCNQKAALYRNNIGNNNNWLEMKLVGTKSNKDGIGARVKVVADSFAQIREVNGGNGYASQSSFRLHFGLGKREKIDFVQINWPSGVVQKITGVAINQILTVIEAEQ